MATQIRTDLQQAFEEARALVKALPGVQFAHVPRAENKLADALANEALDEQARQRPIPREDRRDLVHPLLVRAEAVLLGLAHPVERQRRRCVPFFVVRAVADTSSGAREYTVVTRIRQRQCRR